MSTTEHLHALEAQSVHVLREAYEHFDDLAMLLSMGKESIVLLWLARKAFHGKVPFPLVHLDTGYKMPELIEYRNRLCREWQLNLIISQNKEALAAGMGPEQGQVACCTALKIDALKQTMTRYCWTAIILSIRAEEEGTRAKERYFSRRDEYGEWDCGDRPPERWDPSRRSIPDGSHIRVHPLLDWTECDIMEYLQLEQIPLPEFYFDRVNGTRYRSLACVPCTGTIPPFATTILKILTEGHM